MMKSFRLSFISIVFISSIFLGFGALPDPVLAQTCTPPCPSGTKCGPNNECEGADIVVTAKASGHTFADVVNNGIVPFFDKFVIPLLYAVMFLLFMFGMVRYFFTGGEENREKGKQFVVWGMIGMAAVFSIWGVVNLLLSVLAV